MSETKGFPYDYIVNLETYPYSKVLVEPAQEVAEFGPELLDLAVTLTVNMKFWEGVGLAAPQIGVPLRVLAMDTAEGAEIMVNPKISVNPRKAEMEWGEEGCLSLPGIMADVPRYRDIVVDYQDVSGEHCHKSFSGFPARVIQHEVDHLDGILFVQRMHHAKNGVWLMNLRTYTTLDELLKLDLGF